MSKFLIGVATAALWFALSYAAKAESVCADVDIHASGVAIDIAP